MSTFCRVKYKDKHKVNSEQLRKMYSSKLVAAFLVLASSSIAVRATDPPLVVKTTSGKVQGFLDTSTTSVPLHKWYGVRFAQDTSGANRWLPPKPYFDRTSTFNATAFGPACLQGRANGGNGTSVQSEDCLRINVIAPVGAKNLPVYIYS